MTKEFIILHHTGVHLNKPQFDIINQAHKRRGFPRSRDGYWGGYHILLDIDRQVKRYREDWEVGAHSGKRWANEHGIGICIAGDFRIDKPTEWQKRTLNKLVNELRQKHGIKERDVLLHYEVKATACPVIDWRVYLTDDPPVTELRPRAFQRALARAKRRFSGRTLERILKRLERRFG